MKNDLSAALRYPAFEQLRPDGLGKVMFKGGGGVWATG